MNEQTKPEEVITETQAITELKKIASEEKERQQSVFWYIIIALLSFALLAVLLWPTGDGSNTPPTLTPIPPRCVSGCDSVTIERMLTPPIELELNK